VNTCTLESSRARVMINMSLTFSVVLKSISKHLDREFTANAVTESLKPMLYA
jgi:hypothetical protein